MLDTAWRDITARDNVVTPDAPFLPKPALKDRLLIFLMTLYAFDLKNAVWIKWMFTLDFENRGLYNYSNNLFFSGKRRFS